MFTGFPEETLQFFLDIRFHNDKAYFAEHKARYEKDVKAVFHAFIEELAPQMQKVPYMIVLGDKEVEDKVVALRDRKGGNFGVMSVEDMIAKLQQEIADKVHD